MPRSTPTKYRPATEAEAARSLVGTGALARRAAELGKMVPNGPIWSRAGQPMFPAPIFWQLLDEVHSHTRARRYLQAVGAFQQAKELVQAHLPTILEARRRAQAEATAERQVESSRRGAQVKRLLADDRATPYVKEARRLRGKRVEWSREAIITEIRRRDPLAPSIRTLRRYLASAGVK